MTTSSKILSHRNEDSLHLKLIGDFDITSASEILRVLKKNSRGTSNVFIHTSCLKGIQPNARVALHNYLKLLNGHSFRFVFTGQYSGRLAPKGTDLY